MIPDYLSEKKTVIALVVWLLWYPLSGMAGPIDSLERVLEQAPAVDSAYVETQLDLSRQYHRLLDHGDHCLDVANEAVQHALDLGDTFLYAKALDNLGLLYRYHQYYAQAIPLHQKAFELTEALDVPPLSKMIFANNTGVAARHNGNYDISVTYYLKALALAEQEDDDRNREIANNGLGIALMSIPGREEEALEHFHRALDIAKAAGNTLGQAMNYLSIGSYYDEQGDHRTAREYFLELKQLNEEMGDRNGMAITLEAIGNSYLMEGADLATARRYFEQALAGYEALGNPLGQATVLSSIGEVYRRSGLPAQALDSYLQAYAVGDTLQNYTLMEHAATAISDTYDALGDAGQALRYYRVAQQYKDSLAMHEQQVSIAAIRRQYDLESKEAQIALLTKDKQLAEAKLHRRSLTFFAMLGGLAVVAAFAFFRFRMRRMKRRSEELIKQQKDAHLKALYEKNLMEAEIIATRMQINPHFMFNCLGSVRFLVERRECERALHYLVQFSRFIRRVLEISHRPVHCVSDELKLLDQYLKLEQNRFDGEFTYTIVNEMEAWENRDVVPALLLQPFVENAICHGLAPSPQKDKHLRIVAASCGEAIELTVEDNGVGLPVGDAAQPRNDGHTSMGHRITDKRIDLYNKSYRDQIRWHIENRIGPDGAVAGARAHIAIRIGDSQPVEMAAEVS